MLFQAFYAHFKQLNDSRNPKDFLNDLKFFNSFYWTIKKHLRLTFSASLKANFRQSFYLMSDIQLS